MTAALTAGADLSDAFLTGIISGLSAGAFSQALNSESGGEQADDSVVAEFEAKVGVLINGLVEAKTDFESLSFAVQTNTPVELKFSSDGTITVTAPDGAKAYGQFDGLLEGAGLKGRFGTVSLRVDRHGTASFSGKVSGLKCFGGFLQSSFGFGAKNKCAKLRVRSSHSRSGGKITGYSARGN